MKVKQIEKTVNTAWSPSEYATCTLIAGTAAQQVDASFNSSASIDVYQVDLADPSLDMEPSASIPCDHRFYKVCWGAYACSGEKGKGIVLGGLDGGRLVLYNAGNLIEGENVAPTYLQGLAGPVRTIDFNTFQRNLFAAGSSESKILIWDANNLQSPMCPGSVPPPADDVTSLCWNRQVQHILATTFPTRCLVWDLRKGESIIKLTDSASKIRWKDVKWHPEMATQLCLASEDDQYPVIQLWDLRFATSPIKTLEGHQKGVLSTAWCERDPDLFISCGKDNKLFVWNPNAERSVSDEIVCDVTLSTDWNFEVNWCPRNPFLICTSSFDGRTSVYSLSSGDQPVMSTSNKIADSFPGMNSYSQPMPHHQQQSHQHSSLELRKPPKWLRRPSAVSFAFGGKLVIFNGTSKQVSIYQTEFEEDLVDRNNRLQSVAHSRQFYNYALEKQDANADPAVKLIWQFLACQFESADFKNQTCKFLGISQDELTRKVSPLLASKNKNDLPNDEIATKQNGANFYDDGRLLDENTIEGSNKNKRISFIKSEEVEGAISESLILCDFELAVDLCLKENRVEDALVISTLAGPELMEKVKSYYFKNSKSPLCGLIAAIATRDWYTSIATCDLTDWKEMLATIMSHAAYNEMTSLCQQLGRRLEEASEWSAALICYASGADINSVINCLVVCGNAIAGDIKEFNELTFTLREMATACFGYSVEVHGWMAEVLVQYALMLISNGHLETALYYLQNAGDGHQVLDLRERITSALYSPVAQLSTQKSSYYQHSQPVSAVHPYSSSVTPKSVVKPYVPMETRQFNGQQPPLPSNPPPQPSLAMPPPRSLRSSSASQQYPQNIPSHSTHNGGSTPQYPGFAPQVASFSTYQPTPTPISPPTPSNVYTPSASAPSFPQSIPTNVFTSATPHSAFSNSTFPHASSGHGVGIPPPLPPANAPFSKAADVINHQGKSKYVVDPSVSSGSNYGQPSSFRYPPANASVNSHNQQYAPYPSYNGSDFSNQTAPYQPPVTPDIAATSGRGSALSVSVPPAPSGWNDPPMVSPTPKNVTHNPTPTYAAQNPVTHPLYGAESSTRMQADVYNPGDGYDRRSSGPTPSTPLPEVVPKKNPFPQEHERLRAIFNELLNGCVSRSTNLLTKHKLDDVAQKLELLYDLIRDRKLSGNTLNGLHQIVQCIQSSNYDGCLAIYTQMVSGEDFTLICGFMPAIKTLIHCASQMNVFL